MCLSMENFSILFSCYSLQKLVSEKCTRLGVVYILASPPAPPPPEDNFLFGNKSIDTRIFLAKFGQKSNYHLLNVFSQNFIIWKQSIKKAYIFMYKGNSRPCRLRRKLSCLHTYSWENWQNPSNLHNLAPHPDSVWMLSAKFSKAICPSTKAPLFSHLANQFLATGKRNILAENQGAGC